MAVSRKHVLAISTAFRITITSPSLRTRAASGGTRDAVEDAQTSSCSNGQQARPSLVRIGTVGGVYPLELCRVKWSAQNNTLR